VAFLIFMHSRIRISNVLGMQGFDFAQIYHSCPKFASIFPKFRFNLSKFCPNPTKFAQIKLILPKKNLLGDVFLIVYFYLTSFVSGVAVRVPSNCIAFLHLRYYWHAIIWKHKTESGNINQRQQ